MSNTVFIPLNGTTWKSIKNAITGNSGIFSNVSAYTVVYVQSDTVPSDNKKKGHTVPVGGHVRFNITSGDIYVRSVRNKARIAVTPGDDIQ